MDQLRALMSFEAAAWTSFAGAAFVLGLMILFQMIVLPSTRLSVQESRVSLSGRRASKQLLRMAAVRLPRGTCAWNDFADRHDPQRLRVRVLAASRRRRIVGFSLLVAGLMIVAFITAISRELVAIATESQLSQIVAARIVGLAVVALYGWVTIPTLTHWLLMKAERDRTPLEWRLLSASSSIGWLIEPPRWKAGSQELPHAGRISNPKARQILRRLEAEAIETLSPSKGAQVSDHTLWRARVAPRLSLLLESKARLLDTDGEEVRIDAIYEWMNDLVELLVSRRVSSRRLRRIVVAPELLDGSARATARAILEVRFSTTPAAVLLVLLSIVMVSTFSFALLSESQPLLTENPRLLDALGAVGGIALTGIVTYLVSMAVRMRR